MIKRLKKLIAFSAGDNSKLREIINPKNEKLRLRYSLAHAKVGKNKKTLRHRLKYSEVYFVLKGTGVMHIDSEEKVVRAGDTVYIPPKSIQYIENIGNSSLEFLCIVDPAWDLDCEEILTQPES